VLASSCRPSEDWVDPDFHRGRVRDFIDVYLHEETHAHDLGVKRRALAYLGRSSEEDLRSSGDRTAAEYVNLPVEVKGFGRNVYEEAVRELEFRVTGGELDPDVRAQFLELQRRRHRDAPARLLEKLITSTPSWRSLVRNGLTPANQRRILRDVYQQLAADGWVERLEEMLRG
jgi:hypothetical protein